MSDTMERWMRSEAKHDEEEERRRILKEKPSVFSSFLTLPRLMFITINPNKGSDGDLRINRIGKWSDFLKRYSDNFLIIMEVKHNIHFHALVSMRDDKPVKGVKGVHFKIDPVSKPASFIEDGMPVYIAESVGELVSSSVITPEEADILLERRINAYYAAKPAKAKAQRANSKRTKLDHIVDIIRYMNKESPSVRYMNYVYILNSKSEPVILS